MICWENIGIAIFSDTPYFLRFDDCRHQWLRVDLNHCIWWVLTLYRDSFIYFDQHIKPGSHTLRLRLGVGLSFRLDEGVKFPHTSTNREIIDFIWIVKTRRATFVYGDCLCIATFTVRSGSTHVCMYVFTSGAVTRYVFLHQTQR